MKTSQGASRALGYGQNNSRLAIKDNSSFTTRLGHYTTHIPYKQPAETSTSLAILENVPALLNLSIPGSNFNPASSSSDASRLLENGVGEGTESSVSLFKATIPTSELAKQRRRRVRGGVADDDLLLLDGPGNKIGLKKLGDRARGLLTNEGEEQTELELEEERSRARKSRRRRLRKGRGGKGEGARELGIMEGLGLDELTRQVKEIAVDKDNLTVRKVSTGDLSEARQKHYQACEILIA
jgi:division protein 1